MASNFLFQNYGIGATNYDNPTFSVEDRDRQLASDVDSSNVVVQVDQSALPIQREMSKFREIPEPTKEDYMKLSFLIGFPLVFFIVAIVITGVNV